MDTRKQNRRQKLLFAAFVCYGLSFSLLLGMDMSVLKLGRFVLKTPVYIVGVFLTFTHGLFLFGLLQPQKRKKVLALALLLKGGLLWFWSGVQYGSFLYALMSYPIDFYADALLVGYILSTKRGITLRIVTELLLGLRAIELVSRLLSASDGAFFPEALTVTIDAKTASPACWIIGSVVILARFAALFLLLHGLRLPEARQEETERKRLDENYLASVEREKAELLCLECGSSIPSTGDFCGVCGKALRKEHTILENFPEKEKLSPKLCRAYEKLKERDWDGAREIFCAAVENDTERAYAFIGLLLAELQYVSFSELRQKPVRLELQELWQQAVNASREEEKVRLIRIRRLVFNFYEEQRRQRQYKTALSMRQSESLDEVLDAAREFAALGSFAEAPTQARYSFDLAREMVYREAAEQEQKGQWQEALRLYREIPGWKDVQEREKICKKMEEQSKAALSCCGTGGKIAILGCFVFSALLSFLIFL